MDTVWTNQEYPPRGYDSPMPDHPTPQALTPHPPSSDHHASHGGDIEVSGYLVSDTESQFLRQLEHNFYDDQLNHHAPHGAPATQEEFLFISDEIMGLASRHHHKPQTAYPPLDLPLNTPALLAKKGRGIPQANLDGDQFALPVLPSQNDRSYNEEHLYHKQKYQQQLNVAGIRPDAVYTPLVLPAVTPLDKYQQMNQAQGGVPTNFEPLTLPALSAINSDILASERRRLLSLAFGNQAMDTDPQYALQLKRRTPHLTPIMAPTKLLPSLRGKSGDIPYPKHPQPPSGVHHQPSPSHHQPSPSSHHLPALQPQQPQPQRSNGGTPLMGFTMGILAEQELIKNEHNSPQTTMKRPLKLRTQLALSLNTNNNANGSTNPSQNNRSSLALSLETLPQMLAAPSKRGEKPPTKKASHKLAEQGRRNRMNQAVHDLGELIPKLYHDLVTIPSKATTVELASTYIKDLLERIEELEAVKQE